MDAAGPNLSHPSLSHSASIPSQPSHYHRVQLQEHQRQRHQARRKEQRHRQKELQREQHRIKKELRAKKQLLSQLSHEASGLDASRRAQGKREQDQLARVERETAEQRAADRAERRGRQATRRQATLEAETRSKQTQAGITRATHQWTAQQERRKAKQAHQSQAALARSREQEQRKTYKQSVLEYKSSLGRRHTQDEPTLKGGESQQPLVVRENEEEQPEQSATARGRAQQRAKAEREEQLGEGEARRRSVAERRGEAALARMRLEKEYSEYCLSTQQEQVRLNLRRVAQAHSHQQAGLKPTTLAQMQRNKQLRAQQEFEDLFMGQAIGSGPRVASRHQIVEERLKDPPVEPQPEAHYPRQPIAYGEQESLIPGQSEAHYSFQESGSCSRRHTSQGPPAPILREGKTGMRETRVEGGPELDYSEDSIH